MQTAFATTSFAVHQKFKLMQSNDFYQLNGFIAKLTQAATKGMKRETRFKKTSNQSTVEMKENTRTLAVFDNGLNQIKGMD